MAPGRVRLLQDHGDERPLLIGLIHDTQHLSGLCWGAPPTRMKDCSKTLNLFSLVLFNFVCLAYYRICRGSGLGVPPPICRDPHPRFAGDRGSTPIPIPDLPESESGILKAETAEPEYH